MAKDNERRLARDFYVKHGKTQKEIAEQLSVTEKTVGSWVSKFGWKAQRDAVQNAPDKAVENLKEVISQLTEERLNLTREHHKVSEDKSLTSAKRVERIAEISSAKARLADEISKWSKALEAARKEDIVSLSTYIKVMESVFMAIKSEHPNIYLKLVDFQEDHLMEVARKY